MSMEQMLKDIINEETEEKKDTLVIDNGAKAEWALKKIIEQKKELTQFESVCDAMISDYKDKKEKKQQQFKNNISFLEMKLKDYFDIAEKKVSKTKESVKLPSGSLELKYSKEKFIKDDDALVKWLKENDKAHLIKTKEEPMWNELKPYIKTEGGLALTGEGEIIEGIKVETTEPQFEVKV